jgi:hypothetical protein
LINGKKKALILPDNFKDLYSFEDIINLQSEIFNRNIQALDLSGITFIEPYSMINLLLIGRNYLRNTGEKLHLFNIPLSIHQYLARMDFFGKNVFLLFDRLDEKFFLKRSSFSKRVIEIVDLPNKERESVKVITDVISLFRKRASHILKYWIVNNNIVDFFVTVISEICQNVFEHSMDSGFIAMQTYNIGSEHVVRLVISDSGIGIRGSFENKKEISFDSNAKLIESALTTPISSKRSFGYGLCQVNSIVEKLRGSIFIRSENASVAMFYNRKLSGGAYSFLKNELGNFPGTQISVTLTG